MPFAPLCVPAEITLARGPAAARGGGPGADGYRWFRLALGIDDSGPEGAGGAGGPDGDGQILLRSPLPEELRGEPLRVRLHLPPPTERLAALVGAAWSGELVAYGTIEELRIAVGTEHERAELRLLVLQNLDPTMREQITRYTTLRTE